MSRILDVYLKTYPMAGMMPSSSTSSSQQFIVSSTLSGEGVYSNWRSMWEKISLTAGPQVVYIHGNVEITAITAPETFDFKRLIEVRGINDEENEIPSLTIKTNVLLLGCTKFSNMSLIADGNSYPIFANANEQLFITLDGVWCSSTQSQYPLFNSGENAELYMKIVNVGTSLRGNSIGLTGGTLEIANYGLQTELNDNWLTDNTAGEMSSSVYISQYSPMKISNVLTGYMVGENSFPEIYRLSTTAYMTFGGLINSTGFALPNAVPGAVIPEFGGTVDTQWLCPITNGFIQEIMCNTQTGNQFTSIQLKMDGVTMHTFQLPPSGKGTVRIPSISVAQSHPIELYFEVGENVNPGKSSFTVIVC